jgi:hypothetical protein
VWVKDGAHDNIIGPDNLIAFNGRGVFVSGGGTRRTRITRNHIHSSTTEAILLLEGGNDELGPPVITTADAMQVSGTACGNCTVEIFSDAAEEGAIYEGTTLAMLAGNWSYTKAGGLAGSNLTATATDAQGNTSQFSAPVSLTAATPTLTPPVSPTATHTRTPTLTISPTGSAPATSTPTRTASVTPTRTDTSVATGSMTATRTPTPTPEPPACSGDCNGDGSVTVDEIIRGVNIALGNSELSTCPSFDGNGNGAVTIDELIQGVNAALTGCPA